MFHCLTAQYLSPATQFISIIGLLEDGTKTSATADTTRAVWDYKISAWHNSERHWIQCLLYSIMYSTQCLLYSTKTSATAATTRAVWDYKISAWQNSRDIEYNVSCILSLSLEKDMRDGVGREEGGGFRMGNTCIPVADSFWYLAKLIQLCKV